MDIYNWHLVISFALNEKRNKSVNLNNINQVDFVDSCFQSGVSIIFREKIVWFCSMPGAMQSSITQYQWLRIPNTTGKIIETDRAPI